MCASDPSSTRFASPKFMSPPSWEVPAGWRIKTRARAAIERASPSNGQKTPDRCLKGAQVVILPKVRDPRFITIRRGGTLTDPDHRLLAQWAALCAEHVLPLFESARPDDSRPRQAIEQARAWARGHVTMTAARTSAGHAMAAARNLGGAARHAAYAA